MQINPTTSQLNFKWNRTAHLEMTALALKDCNLPDKVKKASCKILANAGFLQTRAWFSLQHTFLFS